MNCKYVRNLMGAYIYGDLSPEDMRIVRMHTQDCASCKADLTSRGSVISSINHTTPGLNDNDRQRILWRTNDAINNTSHRQPKLKLIPAFAVLGMLIAGYIIGILISNQPHKAQEIATQPSIINKKDKTIAIPTLKKEKVFSPNVTATNKIIRTKDTPIRDNTADRLNSIVGAVRRSVTIGTITSRNEEARKQSKTIIIDEPLPVVSSPNKINTEVKKNDTKMPEPKGLTEAQTIELPKNK